MHLTIAALSLILLGVGMLLLLCPERLVRAISGHHDPTSVSMLPFALGLLLLGLLLAGMNTRDGIRAAQSRQWTPTSATITHSALVETMQPRSTTRGWRPDIRYTYAFEGQPHTGSRLRFDATTSSDREGTWDWLQQHYPVGRQVTAYVNPVSPQQAVLEPGGSPWVWLLAGIGLVLAGCGIWLLRTAWKPT